MSDLVKRLLFRSSDEDGVGWLPNEIVHVPAGLLHEAADTITRLTKEVEKLKGNMRARLADHINGTPCAEIRWQQERETLTARVKELEGALRFSAGYISGTDQFTSWHPEMVLRWIEENCAALSAQPAPWPEGFFRIERSIMDHCASEGCGQIPSMRLEVNGVGSVYCDPCARKIATTIQPAPSPVRTDSRFNNAERIFGDD